MFAAAEELKLSRTCGPSGDSDEYLYWARKLYRFARQKNHRKVAYILGRCPCLRQFVEMGEVCMTALFSYICTKQVDIVNQELAQVNTTHDELDCESSASEIKQRETKKLYRRIRAWAPNRKRTSQVRIRNTDSVVLEAETDAVNTLSDYWHPVFCKETG